MGERSAMRIRCLHCREPMEVPDGSDLVQVNCPRCAGNFSLLGKETVEYALKQVTDRSLEKQRLGHFDLVRLLGKGSFGSVWLARDAALDRMVAIKVPRLSQLGPDETEQFVREARAAAQLRHANIVGVHEIGREGETLYIVSDFISGITLRERLLGDRPSAREAAELAAKVADALHHAHQAGVIHRDLKPSNIMIDAEGEPHLMDFGLARREGGEPTLTRDGQVLGTPAYMPPEQARGESHHADSRSDVYSLGVILYEMLTGEVPFRGNPSMLAYQIVHDEPPSLRKFDQRVPRELETICLKCLHKKPERRYATAVELASDLRRWLGGQSIRARRVTRVERTLRWCGKKPWAAAALGLLVFTLASTSFGLWRILVLHQQERENLRRSLYHEARALRQSTDSQRRHKALAALEQAAAIRPGPELREEYLRCLELAGLEPAAEIPLPNWRPGSFGDFAALIGQNQIVTLRPGRNPGRSDAAGGSSPREIPHLGPWANPGLVSPHGCFLAAATIDGRATQVWDLHKEQLLDELRDADGQSVRASCLAFGRNDDRLVVTRKGRGGSFDIFLYDLTPVKPTPVTPVKLVESWHTSANEIDCLSLPGYGRGLIASVQTVKPFTHAIRTWRLPGHQEKTLLLSGRGDWSLGFHPRRLSLSDHDRILAAGGSDGTVKAWEIVPDPAPGQPPCDDVLGREVFAQRAHGGDILAVQFSPDGRWLASTAADRLLKLWEVSSESLSLAAHVPVDTPFATNLHWSETGDFVLADSSPGLRRWDVARPISRHLAPAKNPGHYLPTLQFSQTDRWLACTSQESVTLLDLDQPGAPALSLPLPGVRTFAFSPSDDRIALVFHDRYELWELPTPRRLTQQRLKGRDLRALAFNPARELVAAGIQDLHLKVWNLCSGRELFDLAPENILESRGPEGRVSKMALVTVDLGPSHLAVVDGGRTNKRIPDVKVYALTDGRQVFAATPPVDTPRLAGQRRLAVSGGSQIRLYDLTDPQRFVTLSGHQDMITDLAFNCSGDMLASLCAGDGTARLWQAEGHECLAVFHTRQKQPTRVALSPAGRWLSVADNDGQLKLWDLGEVRSRLLAARLDWARQ
jgi:WD40 repeat protein